MGVQFLDISSFLSVKFYTFAFGLWQPISKAYSSIASQSPPQVKRAYHQYWDCSHTGVHIPF